MGERPAKDQFHYSIATLPPTLRHRHVAFAVVVVTLGAFGAVLPFSGTPLPRIDSFIPTVVAIAFVTDLVTAVLLFGQFSATGSRALLMLASGYLFSSLVFIPFVATFPGAFAPTGLLGAGPQSAAWLSVSMRSGLALATIGYALLTSGKPEKDLTEPSPRLAIFWSVAIVIVLVVALTSPVTAGHDFMPRVLDGRNILPLGYYANGMIALMNALALLLLWSRGRSVLDLWLMVAVCAQMMEMALVIVILGRFTVGFYATRVISLLVSKVVLIALLSETVRLHARLLQRQRENRLTSAEAVVAALAHEVRQPLAGMTTRAGAGSRFLDQTPPNIARAQALFEGIKGDALRANEVFEGFLSLFRGGDQEHQPVDMNALALEAVQLLRPELDDHNIVAQMMLASELPAIEGNRGQLREVLLNLIQNATEAMATTTRQRVISVVTARHGSDSISISLRDTGPGIEPDKLASIFDPFVTTKAKGTGLGLAICEMIIRRHGGELSAASDVSGGACFKVTLPTHVTPALKKEALASDDALEKV